MEPPSAALVERHFLAQLGLITPAQLRAAGVSAREEAVRVDRGDWARVDRGDWARVEPGIVRLRGVAREWRHGPMLATLLAPGAGITAGTALRLHGLDGYADYEALLVVARNGAKPRLPAGFKVWQSRVLGPDDLMVRDGVNTVTVPVALAHAFAIDERDLVGRAVDDALRRPGCSPAWLKHVADRWTGRGIPGSGRLAAALDERCDSGLPRSWFERLARRALAEHGIQLEHEVEVRDGTRRLAVVDLAEVRWKVGLECQSWAWHATPAARRADAARKRRLRRLGWEIIELWWSDLHDLTTVVADVQDAIDRQRRLLGTR